IVQRLSDTNFCRFDIFFWDHATDNSIDKFKALATLIGSRLNPYITILAMTTRLAHILALSLGFTADRLAVGDLGSSHVSFYFDLAEQAILHYFQVQFAHAADDCLAALRVGAHLEGRIFFRQLGQSDGHLILVSTCLWLDSNRDYRLWERDGF